jgi:hypothetical protein
MDKSLMTYRMNFGQMIRSVGYAWYIEGLKEKILVDAVRLMRLDHVVQLPRGKWRKVDGLRWPLFRH